MDSTSNFDLGYDMNYHLDPASITEENEENLDLDILQSLFREEITLEEVSSVENQMDVSASVSNRVAEDEMEKAFLKERTENFSVPQIIPTGQQKTDKKRFKTVSEKDLKDLQEKRQSMSTLKSTKWGVKTFQGRYNPLQFKS
jgi:hypothetical protein